jgi:hypothetical protein
MHSNDRIFGPFPDKGGLSTDRLIEDQQYARLADSPLAATPAMAATRKELLALAKECEDLAGNHNS